MPVLAMSSGQTSLMAAAIARLPVNPSGDCCKWVAAFSPTMATRDVDTHEKKTDIRQRGTLQAT
jgi:hypothetical protein